MKLLILALDAKTTDKRSIVAGRFVVYGENVEHIDVVVPSHQKSVTYLSSNVIVYGVSGFHKILQLITICIVSCKLVVRNKTEVISSQDPYYLGLVALVISRMFNRALEIQIHGFDQPSAFKRMILRVTLPRAHSIRVVSERIRRTLIETMHVHSERIVVCPIYSNYQEFKKNNTDVTLQNRTTFTFITVSRLVSIKNISLQLRAMARLKKEGILAQLRIVGEGAERNRLIALCYQLDIHDRVHFVGYMVNPSRELSSADCFMLTSYDEGYGLAAVEAACSGLPVIMTDVGCAGEVIIQNENGIIIPVNDEDALVNAMKRIISDDALRNTMKQNTTTIHERLLSLTQTIALYKQSWETALCVHSQKN